MDKNHLRPLSKTQVISALEKATAFGGGLWQTKGHGERVLCPISQMYIEIKYDKVIVRTAWPLDVDVDLPLYVRLNYRNIVFKLETEEFKIMGDKMIFDYPSVARALEPRNGPRYIMPIGHGPTLSLLRIKDNVRECYREMRPRIMDISEQGLGITITGEQKSALAPGDQIYIPKIDDIALGDYLFGAVRYMSDKGYFLMPGEVRVGLLLNQAFEKVAFELLKSKSQKILSA